MTTYVVRRRADGAEVMRYTADSVVEWEGCGLDACDHEVVPDETPPAPIPRPPQVWERTDFMRRFTAAERIAARRKRASDPILDDFWGLLESTPVIHSDGVELRTGLGYLVMIGVLTPERVLEIQGDAP